MGNPNGHLVHGLYYTPLYGVWTMMKQRCTNPKCRSYKWYGAKGINVCTEWLNVKVFYEWAIANGYRDGLTIERIDVNADYSPQNCKWIAPKEQAKNRTSTHHLTYNGETHSVTEWGNLLDIPRTTLSNRVRLGWSIERALSTPARKGVNR